MYNGKCLFVVSYGVVAIFLLLTRQLIALSNMPLAIDLLHPIAESESRKHKLTRLVQSPNSFFMVWSLIFRYRDCLCGTGC